MAKRKKAPAASRSRAVSRTAASGSRSRTGKKAASRAVAGANSRANSSAVAAASITNSAALTQMHRVFREIGGIVCFFAALIAVLALTTFNINDPGWSHTGEGGEIHNSVGRAGAWFSDVSFYLLGFMAYLVPILLAVAGWLLFRDRKHAARAYQPFAFMRIIGIALMLFTASGLADLHFGVPDGALPRGTFGGGVLGTEVAWRLVALMNPLGTTLLLLALFFCSMTMAFGTSWISLIESMGAIVLQLALTARTWFEKLFEVREERAKVRAAAQTRAARLQGSAVMPVGDALLDGGDAGPIKTGLAAALEAARNKASERSAAAATAAGSVRASGIDPLGSVELDADTAVTGVTSIDNDIVGMSPVKQALARAASVVTPAAATATPAKPSINAAPSIDELTPAAPRKKSVAINPRSQEQQQTNLSLNVPDSELPPISLLDAPEPQTAGFSEAELEALSRLLEQKLAEFKIQVEVVAAHPGPVITRFEMQLAPGIKASRITGLSQDIARSLSIVSVRVVEVIPGRSTIGIEVPNENREIVQLSEMLMSDEYAKQSSPLTLALGKDISGNSVTADLARMPHLLVAGTTGSGKSVAVNSMLVSLLYKAKPSDLRLILIDPKMLELNVYDGIPHLLSPVVTDMKEAANALRWCVGEMERRYTVMAELQVRGMAGFNKRVREAIDAGTPIVDPLYQAELSLEPTAAPPTLEPMPYIVVVVDEFADMMMQVGKKAEEMIARIAQKARAAGIHLILATQRPSVDVITGLIKANVPTRIAFQVSQKVDSRTIIDQGGAESLLGHGDMLYLPPGVAVPVRVHGAFVDDHEVQNVAAHIRSTGEPAYIEEILRESIAPIPGLTPTGSEKEGELDVLYDQAVAIVCESRKASISYVQRRLKIGYNRAATMVEEMEKAGVVSTVTSSGTREVLAPPPV